jgi:UV excision repair protein RAD23
VEGSESVGDLKQKIENSQGDAAQNMKIIYAGASTLVNLRLYAPTFAFFPGKVLPDEKTIESCNIKEKDFLVLMISKVCLVPRSTVHVHACPS